MSTHTDVEEKPWWKKLQQALAQKDKYNRCEIDYVDLSFALEDYSKFRQALTEMKEAGAREAYEAVLDELMNGMTQEQAITFIKQTLNTTNKCATETEIKSQIADLMIAKMMRGYSTPNETIELARLQNIYQSI